MIQIDNTNYNKHFDNLKKQSKTIYNKAVKGLVEKLAFETKKKAEYVVTHRFKFKNSGTLKRSQKKIIYTKPKIIAGKWESEVGAVGDLRSASQSGTGAYWLGEQELGKPVKQRKYQKSALRSDLMTRVISSKMKPKQVKRIGTSNIETPFPGRKGLAIGIRRAKQTGKKYVISNWGVFQVETGKYIKNSKNATKIYNFRKAGITRKKSEWLKPATTIISRNYERYALSEIDRAFKESIGG